MNEPKYHYSRRFNGFNIYEKEAEGLYKKIGFRMTKEDARREVYRLNGWAYKEPQKQNK